MVYYFRLVIFILFLLNTATKPIAEPLRRSERYPITPSIGVGWNQEYLTLMSVPEELSKPKQPAQHDQTHQRGLRLQGSRQALLLKRNDSPCPTRTELNRESIIMPATEHIRPERV